MAKHSSVLQTDEQARAWMLAKAAGEHRGFAWGVGDRSNRLCREMEQDGLLRFVRAERRPSWRDAVLHYQLTPEGYAAADAALRGPTT